LNYNYLKLRQYVKLSNYDTNQKNVQTITQLVNYKIQTNGGHCQLIALVFPISSNQSYTN